MIAFAEGLFFSKERWLAGNTWMIVEALLYYRELLEGWGMRGTTIDPTMHHLSEMPLCGAVKFMELPRGYRFRDGVVKLDDGRLPHDHVYAINGDTIIDPTVGQFFLRSDDTYGEAIGRLVESEPELFFDLDRAVVLWGEKEEIHSRLGIKYL